MGGGVLEDSLNLDLCCIDMETPQLPTVCGPALLILHHLTFSRGTEFRHGFKLGLGRVEDGVIGVVGVRGTPWVRG
jgi:hypothetical protein